MEQGFRKKPRAQTLKPTHWIERLFLLRRKGPFSLVLEGKKECLRHKHALIIFRAQGPSFYSSLNV